MPTTQVILTRHAEKEAGSDPGLTAAGRRRATFLGDLIKHMSHPLGAVYTSTARRTIETGDLATQAAGATVTPVREQDPAAVARAINGRARADEVILVVHHSNTLGDIVRALRSSASPPEIGETEFDHLWCIALGDRQGERFARYPAGATAPPPAGGSGSGSSGSDAPPPGSESAGAAAEPAEPAAEPASAEA
jgi:phosphohistidine phosphatase SixA